MCIRFIAKNLSFDLGEVAPDRQGIGSLSFSFLTGPKRPIFK